MNIFINRSWLKSPYTQGALWKIASFLCFSVINGIVRYLAQYNSSSIILPSYEIAFFQNFFGVLFLLPWIFQQNLKNLITKKPSLQIFRIFLSAIGIVLWYAALAFLPLSEAVALMFLGPIFTTLGARIFLKESIGYIRGGAICIGFCGGLIISHSYSVFSYSFSTLTLPIFLPIVASAFFSASTLLVRKVSHYDLPQVTVMYLLVFMAPLLAIPTFLWGQWPTFEQWPLLIAMGGLSAAAHLCLTKSYAVAEVSYLIPFGFTKWFASTFIGIIIFSEYPQLSTCMGSIILMSVIIILSYIDTKYRTSKKSV